MNAEKVRELVTTSQKLVEKARIVRDKYWTEGQPSDALVFMDSAIAAEVIAINEALALLDAPPPRKHAVDCMWPEGAGFCTCGVITESSATPDPRDAYIAELEGQLEEAKLALQERYLRVIPMSNLTDPAQAARTEGSE